jgi:hypothetical protein
LEATAREWAQHKAEQIEVTRDMIAQLREDVRLAMSSLKLHGLQEAEAAS